VGGIYIHIFVISIKGVIVKQYIEIEIMTIVSTHSKFKWHFKVETDFDNGHAMSKIG